jgi:hypothetical protein
MRRLIYYQVILAIGVQALTGCSSKESGEETTEGPGVSDIINIPVDEQGNIDSSKLAQIYFPDTAYHFDTVSEGHEIVHVFPFTNRGAVPLVINNVTASCGCTVPIWSRQLIKPGSTGEITVRFRTVGRPGQQMKTVNVSANTIPSVTKIYLEGYVQPDN